MNFIKGMMMTLACSAAFLAAGCMNSELKPDAMNGIYKNGTSDIICEYRKTVELPTKETVYQYGVYGSTELWRRSGGEKYNKRHELSLNSKTGVIYNIDFFSGAKTVFGKFEDGKVIVTEPSSNVFTQGEYTKTDNLPDKETLEKILREKVPRNN